MEKVLKDNIYDVAKTLNIDEKCKIAEEYPIKDGYGMGEIVQIGVDVKNARYAKLQMILTDENGTRVIDGKYDWSNGCITFTFEYGGGITNASIVVIDDGDMGWSNDWDNFNPNRDNTIIK